MPKHRSSFKIDKFLQTVDPELRKKYFSEKGLKLPANINLKDDSLEEFWDCTASGLLSPSFSLFGLRPFPEVLISGHSNTGIL